jgi:uncharacterized membrane protein YphA (DoxX/SURF4 family)
MQLEAAGNNRSTAARVSGAGRTESRPRIPSWSVWVVQGLLAAVFLMTGSMKLLLPIAALTQGMSYLPGVFVRFLGASELLGGLALVLPGLLRFRSVLTPLAAAGLVIIMIGATVLSLPLGVALALMPLVVGILAAFVGYYRWRVAPLDDSAARLPILRRLQAN